MTEEHDPRLAHACAMAVGYSARQVAIAPDPGAPPLGPSVTVTAIDAAAGSAISVRLPAEAAVILANAMLGAAHAILSAETKFKAERQR